MIMLETCIQREAIEPPKTITSGASLMSRLSRLNRATVATVFLALVSFSGAFSATAQSSYVWKNGISSDPNFFPIAVWLQDPRNAQRFKDAGINLYVGLWRGPTSNQLATLAKAGMQVICSQNALALEQKDNPVIVGWMHGDEPDNAQSLGQGKGYGSPVTPEKIIRDYERIRAADPTRPVLLNLGQGVAWDNYIGRGVRRNHPEDYPHYVKGCDIASFDIYPVVHDNAAIAGKLEFVANGVKRLREWAGSEKIVWNCIECTHISNPKRKATPQQVRAEVWMSLIQGSRGIIYFVHQFKPTFREAALLDDADMVRAVTEINRQIQDLAPVLNSATITNAVTVGSSPKEVPVATMIKRHAGSTYLFAVTLRNQSARCSFKLENLADGSALDVLGEGRQIRPDKGEFSDNFDGYGVHLYKVSSARQ
jgi:hypothetical protein